MKKYILGAVFILGPIALLVGLMWYSETLENSKDETHLDQAGTWKRICVEGQLVLTKKKGYYGMSITKLDLKTGLPISCKR